MNPQRLLALGVVAALVAALSLAQLWRDARDHAALTAPRATEIIYDRNGAFLAQIAHEAPGYGYWPLDKIPERLARATLALEDRRFYDHPGVDPRAILRALWTNLTHRRSREGASTIAMQVARMQAPARRGLAAKLREAVAGAALIARFGHEAVLAHYLRLAPYGAESHGAAQAARFYFNKPLADLSWAETALLAALPQAPGRMNLAQESGLRRAAARARRALDRLAAEGAIEPAQAALARSQLAALRPLVLPRRPEHLHLALRYEKLLREGRIAPAAPQDPRIHATIDLGLQNEVARLARRYLNNFRGAGARQVAVMVAARGDNAVLAEVGSATYGTSGGAFDFTQVARSPGSTLKPFVYALAFERGALKTTDLLADVPEGASGVGNADGIFLGPMLPRQALANSRNVPATNLLRRVGLEANFQFLHELGLHDLEAPAESFGIALAIGALPTRLEALMRAYAALADDGVLTELSYAQEQKRSPPRRVMGLDTARLVTSFLADPQARLPSFPRYGPLEYPFAVAVKTGTSQGYRDAWTLAFSTKFLVGVWLGRADAGTMKELTGASSSARLAHAVLTHLHAAAPGEMFSETFPPPPGREPVDLCLSANCGETLREYVGPGEAAAAPAPPSIAAGAAAPLVIATPEHDTHIWLNPEQPAQMNRLALKLQPAPGVGQIVWHIDGAPFETADADKTVFWPMRPGVHRIEARRALQPGGSRPVKVTIE